LNPRMDLFLEGPFLVALGPVDPGEPFGHGGI
jgi:hypothetical protein